MRESIIKRLIDIYPNDTDLGNSVRELYKKRLYNRNTVLRYALWGGLFYVGVVGMILLLVLLNNY
jgi:hypothetical protein